MAAAFYPISLKGTAKRKEKEKKTSALVDYDNFGAWLHAGLHRMNGAAG